MNFRFITKTLHSYIDYPVAVALIAMPFLLGLGESNPMALWLSIATGFAAFGLTFFTDHKTGVVRVLPYAVHLAVDFMVGITFLVAPFILGFTDLDALFYWFNGFAVLAVVALHRPAEVTETEHQPPAAVAG